MRTTSPQAQWMPNARKPDPEKYYNDCIQRIGDLADWFFHGSHSYVDTHHWPDL